MSFDAAWSERRNRHFSRRPIREQPFVRADWRLAVLPFALDMDEVDRGSLVRALAATGASTLAVCGLRDEFGQAQPEVLVPLADFSPGTLFVHTVLGHIETGLFSDAESWAIACSPDGFSVVAATDAVLDELVKRLGGESTLVARVVNMIEEGEFGTPDTARPMILDLMKH